MVRIQGLWLENFRGIREGAIEGLADVSVLIGRNNSGKSSVAEALSRLAHGFSADVDALRRNRMGLWREHRHEAAGDEWPSEVLHRSAGPRRVKIAAAFANDPQELCQVFVDYTDDAVPVFKNIEFRPGQLDRSKPTFAFFRRLTVFLASDGNNTRVEEQLWNQLVSTRGDKRLTAALNEIFGSGIEGMQVAPDGRVRLLFPEYSLTLDSQGEGARAAVRCLLVLSSLRDTMLILEEPESHQHPGSLVRFARALCAQAKALQVQLVLTTHSVECIHAFLAGAKDAGSTAAVHHLSNVDGVLEVKRFTAETVSTLESTGLDIRTLDLYA